MDFVWWHQSNSPENIGFLLPALHIAHIINIIITIKIIQNNSIFDSHKIKVNLDRLAGWLALHCQKVFGDLKFGVWILESAISAQDTHQFDSANRMFLLSKSLLFIVFVYLMLAAWAHSYDFHSIAKKIHRNSVQHIYFALFTVRFSKNPVFISSFYFIAILVLCYWFDWAMMINLRLQPIHRICDCYCFRVITNIDSANAKFSFIFRPKTQRSKVYTYIGSTVKWLDCQYFSQLKWMCSMTWHDGCICKWK